VNWLDILLGILILGCIIEGFSKGLARTLLGFAATILGCSAGCGSMGRWGASEGMVGSEEIANLIGFLLIFAGIVALGGLVAG